MCSSDLSSDLLVDLAGGRLSEGELQASGPQVDPVTLPIAGGRDPLVEKHLPALNVAAPAGRGDGQAVRLDEHVPRREKVAGLHGQ